MSPFSLLRFSVYARDLSEAISEMSHERMQTRVIGSNKFATLDGKTVMVSATATDQEIATALNLDKIDGAAKPLDPVSSNISGLQSGAFQDALTQMRQKIADRQKQAVGKILNAVETGAAKMDAAADDVAAKVDKEISAALQEFAQHTNGGPI